MSGRDTADNHTRRLLNQQVAATKASVDGMAILDEHQRYIYMNESHARIYGYTDSEELVGKKWDLFYDEGQRHWFECHTLPALMEKGYWRGEATGMRRDGSTFSQELSITAIEGGGFVYVVRDITTHKRIEEVLRQSEEQFKILFEQAVDYLVVHDVTGKVVDVNSQACRSLGYSREEMLSMHVGDYEMNLLLAEEREKQEGQGGTLWQRIVANEPGSVTELHRGEHRRKDGTTFPVEVRVGGVLHRGERRILASARDVTEQKRAEEALIESEQRYRSLFDQNPDAVCSFDLEGNYLTANAACEKVSGYTVEELLQMSFMPLIVPEDLERTWQGFERAASGEPQDYEIAITHKDGHRVELHVTSLPILVAGEIVGVYGIAKDITDRKQAKEALAKSEERFRSLVRNAPDVITLLGTDSTILYDSPAIERVLGYQPEERVGTRGLDYVHPADRERARRTFNEALKTSGMEMTTDYRLQHRDGSWRYFEATRTNLLEDPAVRAVVLNYRDVTERKQAEEMLQRQNEYLNALHETSLELVDRLELPDLLEAIVVRAGALVGTHHGYVCLTGPGETELEMRVGKGAFGEYAGTRLKPDDCVPGRVWRSGQAMVVDDYLAWEGRLSQFTQKGLRAVAVVPLKSGPEVVGVIGFAYLEEDRTFGKDEMDLLGRFAGMASVALDNARLYTEIQRELAERERTEEALRQSEERFRTIFENTVLGISIADPDRRLLETNSAYHRITGYSGEELFGKPIAEISYPDDVPTDEERKEEAHADRLDRYQREKRYVRKDGEEIWVQPTISVVRSEVGEPQFFVGTVEDITERKEAEKKLRESEQRLRTVTSGAPVILFSLDRKGTITLSEGKALESVGERSGEAVGKSVFEAYRGIPDILDNVRRALSGEEVTALVEIGELTFETRYSPIWEESGEVSGVVGVATDVTERQVLERELEYRAFHDSLTGLPNRALFSDRLEHALSRRSRQRESVAVLVLDLDNFKLINDSLGHSAGDSLLIQVAERLWSCVRPGDTVARLGGDEFAILVEDIEDRDVAVRVAERIEEKMKRPFSLEEADHKVWATTSIGIAFAGDSGETMGDLLRRADVAMYRVKGRGKADHEIFDSGIDTRFVGRSRPADELRRAIEREELTVRYQPVASLETGEIVYLEALVRWEHPERGLLLPREFVPLAEETGLIVLLDQWVLREACRQERQWREECPGVAPPPVSVNLSTKQLSRPRLVEEITSVLEEATLEPSSLQLEITESATIEDTSAAKDVLYRLKALGVRLAVDDFGTGYSSISYLTQSPVDSVKIDRSVVTALGREPRGEAVISAVIALAHSLGEMVVAEGVEDAEQLEHLRDLGCEFGQGEHFWPALPAAEALDLYLESLRQKPAWASR